MWSLCDRCGFKYRRRQLKKETTGFVVCHPCYDGAYDLRSHPQNKPPRFRREMLNVPDARADVDLTQFVGLEDGGFLLTEAGERILLTDASWDPSQSVYINIR
jgi:hypothetical protein